MIFSLPKTSILAAALLVARAYAACSEISGNYYCSEVSQVIYESIGFDGSYSQVTNFDNSSCTCTSSSKSFSGSLSPLDEEISIHFRGPLNLKQFAYYSYNSTSSKKKRDVDCDNDIAKRHVHHAHKRDAVYVTEYVSVTTTVLAGDSAATSSVAVDSVAAVVVGSSDSSSAAAALTTTSPVAVSSAAAAVTTSSVAVASTTLSVASAVTTSSAAASSSSSSSAATSSSSSASTGSASSSSAAASSSSSASSGSGWTRESYYDSASSSSSGLVFLNSQGGTAGSGVWDSCFGNSLSYCDSDGVSGAASSTVLSDVTIPSNKEFSIFTASECSGDDCGYYRPGIPAYHGFDGNYKVFAFEFGMPSDASSTATENVDMPAIWMLNAQIPRTLQYGDSSCSCWSTGCGEFDVFEVLNSGNDFLTNHLHSGQGSSTSTSSGGGGTSDYIARPTSGTMKAAVIFSDSSITITVLDSSTTFDTFLSDATLEKWIAESSSSSTSVTI